MTIRKILIGSFILLCILFTVIYFYAQDQLNKKLLYPLETPTPTQTILIHLPTGKPLPSKNNANQLVMDYFTNYYTCAKKADGKNIEQSIITPIELSCPYDDPDRITNSLVIQLRNINTYNPILCSQNIPLSIHVSSTTENADGTLAAVVHTYYGTGLETKDNPIFVYLVKIDNYWKINSIVCSFP